MGSNNLASIALSAGRASAQGGRSVVDIITFIEADWGLNMSLFPVQRVILKAFYAVPLDDNSYGFPLDAPVPTDHPSYHPDLVDSEGFYKYRVFISDWRRESFKYYTERTYYEHLYATGRCNVPYADLTKERAELVLSVGRRSGKTEMSAFISAYETYRLISKGDPQVYYGLPPGEDIQIISFATDKDQASVSYNKVSGYFSGCSFFEPYAANHTKTYATFQTPKDIERHGSYADDDTAPATIKITFRSSVAKGSRGAGNIVIILDEMAHFADNGQSSIEAVYKAVTPSQAAFSPKDPNNSKRAVGPVESKLIAISSPLGQQGKFYQIFRQGFESREVSHTRLCIEAPTWEVNPTVEATFLISQYVADANSFFTEFGAQFSDRTRGWISDSMDLLKCVEANHRPRSRGASRHPHFMGLDFALSNDGTAVAIGHVDGDKVVVDAVENIMANDGDFDGVDRLEFSDVIEWVYGFTKRFYIVDGMFDQYAGVLFEQLLAEKGIKQLKRVIHTLQLKSQMFQNFKDLMFDQRLVLYDWPIFPGESHCAYITELLELQVEAKTKYLYEVAAPNIEGKHDDMSDALVRMCWVASQSMSKRLHIGGSSRPHPGHGTSRAFSQSALSGSSREWLRNAQSGSVEQRAVPKRSIQSRRLGGSSLFEGYSGNRRR